MSHGLPSADPKFPVKYYRHPRTGVVVEVDPVGVATISRNTVGDFRSFEKMTDGKNAHLGKKCWSAMDEIKILMRHGWVDIS